MSRSDVLVDADWVEAHIGQPGYVIVEVDEDTSAYDKGHIPSAVKVDWKKDLQDPVRRDFVDKAGFEALLSERGISNDDTVILYGGNNNWFAAYAFWSHKLLRWLVPFFALGLLVSSIALVHTRFYGLALAAQILFYAWAGLGYYFYEQMRRVRYGLIAYFVFAMHLAFLVGFVRCVSRSEKAVWQKVS